MNYDRLKKAIKICAVAMVSFSMITIFMLYGTKCQKVYAADPTGNWQDYAEEAPLEGTTYKITKPEQLAWAFKNMNADMYGITMFHWKIIELENDIDLSSHYWVTNGWLDAIFNGNNHVIRNVTIGTANKACTDTYASLISGVSGIGIIENLGIENIYINGTANTYVGGIAAYNDGMIKNSYVSGSITGTGGAESLFFPRRYSTGGIAGYNGTTGCIQDCYVSASVKGSVSNQTAYCGGITGETKGTIRNCYFTGVVDAGLVGGLTGRIGGGFIVNCYSDVTNMILEGQISHGGIAGQKEGGIVLNCYYTIEKSTGTSSNTVNEGINMKLTDMQNPVVGGAAVSFVDTLNANVPSGCTKWKFVDGVNNNLPVFEAVQAPIFIKNVQPQYNAHSTTNISPQISGGSGNGEVTFSYSGRGATTYGPSSTPPVKVGTYTLTATKAKDNTYAAATAAYNFEIIVNSSIFTIDSISPQTYTGKNITPAPVVKDGITILISGTDYTVSYSNNFNVGQATVDVQGIGNYEGCSGSADFQIKAVATLNKMFGKSISGNQEGTADDPKLASMKVDNTVESISETDMIASDTAAQITFYGTDDTFTTTSPAISLPEGKAKDIYIKITSQGGNVALCYRVTVRRATPIKVNGIVVNGAGNAEAITSNGGTLQMEAAVEPKDSTDKSVTWSITSGDGFADISSTGLLTAKGNGTVRVRAAAKDGSNVYGEKTIDISGQTAAGTEKEGAAVDTSPIDAALSAANTAKSGVSISTNGTDIAKNVYWVTKEQMKVLTDAINTANTAKAAVKTTAEVKAAADALNAAVTVFSSQKAYGSYTSSNNGGGNDNRNSGTGAVNQSPVSEYVQTKYIVEKPKEVTVDLTGSSAKASVAQMNALIEKNKEKPVLLIGNDYTITFEANTMKLLSGKTAYDFGVSFNSGSNYSKIKELSRSSLAHAVSYNYSGELPAEAVIRIKVDTQYAGKKLYYYYYNPEEVTLEYMQSAEVDKDGYATVKQSHCSDYVFLSEKISGTEKAVERLSGSTRVDTSIKIAKAAFQGKLSAVILSTAENYPDSLAASALGYKLNAPILLVGNSDSEQEKVLSYMNDNMDESGKVYIIGGSGAVSKNVEDRITAGGFKNIGRIEGKDRYETAVKIAEETGIAAGTPVILVYGESYADALSVSSIAAVNQYPILMVKRNEIPDIVRKEIAKINPSKVYIIGLNGVISTEVEKKVQELTFIDKSNIVRIGGENRFETSLNIANYFALKGNTACVSTGNNFPDALAGSVYAAKKNAHIILIDRMLSDREITFLKNKKLESITILGGESAVSQDTYQQLSKLLE